LLWCGCFGNGKQHSLTTLTEVFPCFSSVIRQMPELNSQSRGTDRISSELLSLCCVCHCVMLLFLCCSVVIMLCCYCVALLLFVLSYVLIVCTVPLSPGVNSIAVDKYINEYINTPISISIHFSSNPQVSHARPYELPNLTKAILLPRVVADV